MANAQGHELLAKYLEENNLTQTAFAEKIGRETSVLSRLVRGDRRPDIDTAGAIEKVTKGAVPAVAWARLTTSGKAA